MNRFLRGRHGIVVALLAVAGLGASSVAAIAAVGAIGDGGSFTTTLVASHSDRCLTMPAATGARLVQRTCAGSDAQRFTFTPTDGGYYAVRSASGGCLAVTVALTSRSLPARWQPAATRAACGDGTAQSGVEQLALRAASTTAAGTAGAYQLVTRRTGRCLDVLAGSQADGAPVGPWACGSPRTAGNQIWKTAAGLEPPVTAPPATVPATVPATTWPATASSSPVPPATSTSPTPVTSVPVVTPSTSPSPPTTPQTPTVTPTTGANPAWGVSAPPAGAELSRAFTLILSDSAKGYQPKAGECSQAVHARYWTYGPDGLVYPTWHPAKDPSGCTFGHEHGDDPRTAALFATTGWPAFGYTNQQLAPSDPQSQRDEDHVGHKVQVGNQVKVYAGDSGEGTTAPASAAVTMTCDTLVKFHQGTHSPDALTNNLHELIYNARCAYADDGAVIETRFSALLPLGHPGGFTATESCAGDLQHEHEHVGAAVPADSPDSQLPGRFIPDSDCAAKVAAGTADITSMNEFWIAGKFAFTAGLRSFQIFPSFFVLNPSRYFDPASPTKIGRQIDLCNDGAKGFFCDQARRAAGAGNRLAYDDPRSPFNGAQRQFSPGLFVVQNTGPTTLWTDATASRFSTTEFPGAIKQFISGTHAGDRSQGTIRGAFTNYAADSSNRIHAPN